MNAQPSRATFEGAGIPEPGTASGGAALPGSVATRVPGKEKWQSEFATWGLTRAQNLVWIKNRLRMTSDDLGNLIARFIPALTFVVLRAFPYGSGLISHSRRASARIDASSSERSKENGPCLYST
jgi:hypothetical protein